MKSRRCRVEAYVRRGEEKKPTGLTVFLDTLSEEEEAKVLSKFDFIETAGLEQAGALLKPVGGKVLELKIRGTYIRLLMFRALPVRGHDVLLVVCGEKKKRWKLNQRLIKEAQAAREEWYGRPENSGGGGR